MTITATRTAEMHAAIAAERTNDHIGSNPKPYPEGMGAFHALGVARACGETFSRSTGQPATALTWAELQALIAAGDAAATIGADIAPDDGASPFAGQQWANVTQVRAYRAGLLEVRDALLATAKGTNPLGHTV